MEKDVVQLLDSLLKEFESGNDSDVFVFNGPIRAETYRSFRQTIKQNQNRRKNALMILSTLGGSPDDGYRIARSLQQKYEKFTIYIPSLCKSTGTLMAIGASEIILGEFGELGPLDIQIRKADEVWEMSSGLNVSAALAQIENRVSESFTRFFIEMKQNFELSTKTASEIATKLSQGIYSEIAEQIDPIQLGETNRSIRIAEYYGNSLNTKSRNLKEGALERLIAAYPSHGYVIDIQEALSLFNNVRQSNDKELALFDALDAFFNLSLVVDRTQDSMIWRVRDLIDFIQDRRNQEKKSASKTEGEENEQQANTKGNQPNKSGVQQKDGGIHSKVESDIQPKEQDSAPNQIKPPKGSKTSESDNYQA